jgi:hypothetical protein
MMRPEYWILSSLLDKGFTFPQYGVNKHPTFESFLLLYENILATICKDLD